MGRFYPTLDDARLDLIGALEAGRGKIPASELVDGVLTHIRRLQGGSDNPRDEWDKKASRNLYLRRKGAGLCVACGKVPPLPGMCRCEECLAKVREYLRRRQ